MATRFILVITEDKEGFDNWVIGWRLGKQNYVHADPVFIESVEQLRQFDRDHSEVRYVGKWWENPVAGHPALLWFKAPMQKDHYGQ